MAKGTEQIKFTIIIPAWPEEGRPFGLDYIDRLAATFEATSGPDGNGCYTGIKTFYVNGEQVTGDSSASYKPMSSDPDLREDLTIGSMISQETLYFPFNGLIDNVLVFNRPLSASQVRYLYESTDEDDLTKVDYDDSGNLALDHRGYSYEYDAYGKCTAYTDDGDDDTWFTGDDTVGNSSALGNPIAFTGQRLDRLDNGSLLLMYYKNRHYCPTTGRFLQRDPLEYVDGMNLYNFLVLNPINSIDPYGSVSVLPNFPWDSYDPNPFPFPDPAQRILDLLRRKRKDTNDMPNSDLIERLKKKSCYEIEQFIRDLPGVGGHLEDAFNHYAYGNGETINLSEADMKEWFLDYDIQDDIDYLKNLCMNIGDWTDMQYFPEKNGAYYLHPKRGGTWRGTMNEMQGINIESACDRGNGCYTLAWCVSFSEKFDFNKKPWSKDDAVRNTIVELINIFESKCGWTSFSFEGKICGIDSAYVVPVE